MKKFELIHDLEDCSNHWAISGFENAYPEVGSIRKCVFATMRSKTVHPQTKAVIALRLFLQDGIKLRDEQKYIIALRFYNFGKMATLDVISLDSEKHEEIVGEHLKQINALESKGAKPYSVSTQIPFVISGAWVKKDPQNFLKFDYTSFEYGHSMFFANSNAVASYVAHVCGLKVRPFENVFLGEDCISNILDFMVNLKSRYKFYELFVAKALRGFRNQDGLSSQQVASLLMMKVLDRHEREGEDFSSLFIEEINYGLNKHYLLESMALRL